MVMSPETSVLLRVMNCTGLDLLRKAWVYAEDSRRPRWDFAIEMASLIAGGLTATDVRWLIAKGYAEHADETTRSLSPARRFRTIRPLVFTGRTCLLLTDAGFEAVSIAMSSGPLPGDAANSSRRSGHGERLELANLAADWFSSKRRSGESGAAATRCPGTCRTVHAAKISGLVPVWDAALHELRVGKRVVKRFARPAKSQELILAAFEEEGWPGFIDDPLPMTAGQDPKRKLHYTVHHLNRNQRPFLIQFYVNGNGQCIYWRSARDQQVNGARRARQR